MGLLDVVNEFDEVIGNADFEEVHSKGLRHRSVQVFVFQYEDYRDKSKLLVAQRSSKQETSALKLHHSVGGHVRLGQTYEEAVIEEIREELFHDLDELPKGFIFYKTGELSQGHKPFYRNDTRPTNKENSVLFVARYSGPFSLNSKEIERVFWQDPDELWADMKTNSEKYTTSFRNAMERYMLLLQK